MTQLTTKTCSRCGTDLTGNPRVKDTAGRYYCKVACGSPPATAGPAAMETVRRPVEDRHLAVNNPDVEPDSKAIPNELAEIGKWERQLFKAFVPSLLLPPLAALLIPAHAVVAFNLARSLGRNGWLWAVWTLVPYLGLLILVILNIMATSRLRAAGLRVGTFGSWQWASTATAS